MRLPVLLSIILLAVAASAAAQQTSNLTGVVTDVQGAVLPGVTVTVSSPALDRHADRRHGTEWQLPLCHRPARHHMLTFELSGFQTVKRENIVLALGQTISVDLQLQVQGLQESVTVTAASPLVDTQTTSVGSTLKHRGSYWSADGERLVERACARTRRAHAGLRRRRQPQE